MIALKWRAATFPTSFMVVIQYFVLYLKFPFKLLRHPQVVHDFFYLCDQCPLYCMPTYFCDY